MQKKIIILLFVLSALILGACAQEMGQEQNTYIDASSWAHELKLASAQVSAELNDRYAAYFTPEQFQMMVDDLMGSFAGVGIYMNQEDDGRVRVVSVMPNRPAQAAGVEAGDLILAVDGESVAGLDIDSVAMRLRGEEHTEVSVDFLREREDEEDLYYSVTIIRALIENSSVQGQLISGRPGIAYIQIYDFTEHTPIEMYELLLELDEEQEIHGLILDLRTNGGGSFNAAIKIAGFFVPKDEAVVWEKTYRGEVCHRSGDGALAKLPVVCLQDAYTASASEVLIGALMDYDIATVIGDVSYGKGITQVLDILPEGGGLRYTRSRYYTPQKYDLHGKGISPDIEVKTPDDVTYEQYFDPENPDNQHIQKALEVLEQRLELSVL